MDSKVQELMTEGADTNNRVDCISEEVGRLSEHMAQLENTVESRFDRFERLLAGDAHNETANESHSYGTATAAAAAIIEHPHTYLTSQGYGAPAYCGRNYYKY